MYITTQKTNDRLPINLIKFAKEILAKYEHCESGIPTVRYLAGELFLSPNYFGDLVRVKTGGSALQYIRRFVMQKAESMLLNGSSVSEVSYALGFDYPQNLTRMFKKEFGIAPSKIVLGRK